MADLTDVVAVEGQSAELSIKSDGSGPTGYSWFFGDTLLPGINTPNLVINPVELSHAGSYQVIITNTIGSVTSKVATLTVLSPPKITIAPAAQTVTWDATWPSR